MGAVEQQSEGPRVGSAAPDGTSRHLSILKRATRYMAATRDLQGTLEAILRGLTEGPNAVIQARCYIYATAAQCPICATRGLAGDSLPGDPPALHLAAAAGLVVDDHERTHHVFPMGSPLFGEVAVSRQPLLVNGVRDHPRLATPEWRDMARRFAFEGLAVYPMVCQDELLGIFYTISGQRIETEEFEAILENIGVQLNKL